MATKPRFNKATKLAFARFQSLSQDNKKVVSEVIKKTSTKLMYPFAQQLSSLVNSRYRLTPYYQPQGDEQEVNGVTVQSYFVYRRGRKWQLRTKFFLTAPGLYSTLYPRKGKLSFDERQEKRKALEDQGINLDWENTDEIQKIRPKGWKAGQGYTFKRAGLRIAPNWVKDHKSQIAGKMAKAFVQDMTDYLNK